jgi:tripartite-type tricarboxylate transporter receptor subunit TctC
VLAFSEPRGTSATSRAAASPSRPIAIPTLAACRLGTLKVAKKTSATSRAAAFPDTPAVAETKGLEDFDFANWFGLLARAGTPQPVLDKLAAAAIGALKEPKVREVLETQAAFRSAGRVSQRSESAKYTKIVEITGITLK